MSEERRKPVSQVNVIPVMDKVLIKCIGKFTISKILLTDKSYNPETKYQIVGFGPDTRDMELGKYVELNDLREVLPIEVDGNERTLDKLRDLYNGLPTEERKAEIAKEEIVEVYNYVLTNNFNILCIYEGEPTKRYIKDTSMPKDIRTKSPIIMQ